MKDKQQPAGDAGLKRDSTKAPPGLQIVATLGIHLASVALPHAFARTASAQSPVQPPAHIAPVGVWRGTSTCLVRPSACNDEIVVYRITPMKTADSVTLDARKVVRGEEQEMGVLACRFAMQGAQITCAIPHGVWRFSVRNDSLTGELRLLDDTRFREVRAARAR